MHSCRPLLIGCIWHAGFFERSPRSHCKEPISFTLNLQSESFPSWRKSLNQSKAVLSTKNKQRDWIQTMAMFNFGVNVSYSLHWEGEGQQNASRTCWTSVFKMQDFKRRQFKLLNSLVFSCIFNRFNSKSKCVCISPPTIMYNLNSACASERHFCLCKDGGQFWQFPPFTAVPHATAWIFYLQGPPAPRTIFFTWVTYHREKRGNCAQWVVIHLHSPQRMPPFPLWNNTKYTWGLIH